MNKFTPMQKRILKVLALCRQEWRNNSRQHGNWWFTVEKDLKGACSRCESSSGITLHLVRHKRCKHSRPALAIELV
jgi:hypothetical protein